MPQAMMAGGALMSGIGAYQKAQSEKNALNSQAQANEYTAAVRQQQAREQEQVGNAEQTQSGLKYGALYGTQRADLAAHGVDLGSGSASAVLASTKLMSSIDAATIANNANRQAWNYTVAATDYSNQAAGDRAGASNISPLSSGFTSLMGSAARVAPYWYQPGSSAPGTNGLDGQVTNSGLINSTNQYGYPTLNGMGIPH